MPTTRQHQKRIEGDLYCVQCKYNLRTLCTDGRCPECGTPISDTVQASLRAIERRKLNQPTRLYGFTVVATWLGRGGLELAYILESELLVILFVMSFIALCVLTPGFIWRTVTWRRQRSWRIASVNLTLHIVLLLAGLVTIVWMALTVRWFRWW